MPFDATEIKKSFPNLYCIHCRAVQPMLFATLPATETEPEVAEIVCADCASPAVTLHADQL